MGSYMNSDFASVASVNDSSRSSEYYRNVKSGFYTTIYENQQLMKKTILKMRHQGRHYRQSRGNKLKAKVASLSYYSKHCENDNSNNVCDKSYETELGTNNQMESENCNEEDTLGLYKITYNDVSNFKGDYDDNSFNDDDDSLFSLDSELATSCSSYDHSSSGSILKNGSPTNVPIGSVIDLMQHELMCNGKVLENNGKYRPTNDKEQVSNTNYETNSNQKNVRFRKIVKVNVYDGKQDVLGSKSSEVSTSETGGGYWEDYDVLKV